MSRRQEREWNATLNSAAEAARITQRAIDASRHLLIPTGDARELDWAEVMPVERASFFADTELQ